MTKERRISCRSYALHASIATMSRRHACLPARHIMEQQSNAPEAETSDSCHHFAEVMIESSSLSVCFLLPPSSRINAAFSNRSNQHIGTLSSHTKTFNRLELIINLLSSKTSTMFVSNKIYSMFAVLATVATVATAFAPSSSLVSSSALKVRQVKGERRVAKSLYKVTFSFGQAAMHAPSFSMISYLSPKLPALFVFLPLVILPHTSMSHPISFLLGLGFYYGCHMTTKNDILVCLLLALDFTKHTPATCI